ncbi:hypothetical protein DCC81_22940 [Chitinophaga parva]|uniref:Outer membrane protein beta-barrel domain-containing protein n=1 Tax=Chitinophaga parva TaxID=2169414 RepID=A0A2T7BDT2_9BACT|nr:porin family protein [Chitinophaga parva]PUZ23254.1 hypothetical protein DCC81_22940 [Chitinophaga parva]
MIRKVLFTATAILGLTAGAMAQDAAPAKKKEDAKLHYGIKVSLDMTTIDGTGFSAGMKAGFNAGGFVEYSLDKHWGLTADLLYTRFQNESHNFYDYYQKPGVIDEYNSKGRQRVNLNYITVPVMAQYKFSKILSVVAGPQYSILVYDDENLILGHGAFKKNNFGVIGGVNVTLGNWRFFGRYVQGLSNLNNTGIEERSFEKWRTSEAQLGIGVTIK